ncbi:MAG: bifunctional hydroxymethylpyrimidine kinase/phosphomethylpyrimidine kinase [Hyphomicrobium sp.]|uniref:bifunctional hydroxymethylpyrimidine kinase/phosphomethylpyrimidine kinase n=1 Tax=Hyphomicrobium sp. TaxID=82 RepID=UPI001328FBB7|nr:bifunctional hydroxymethylpyrimidine kinase/phosphomethylpyrimidine kinase [Hyphomicrobium sp.]KAB2938419.1 MAG: bifunctional hydroxymethylpyrimidine kinase/phosphomethylpyrimidine kinase [Hyphomicrobium sp.]MBZ0211515.1 bifunctional hydroxymethylpyrimidine kinase/phosphomethylpyrimidine kinase [Hyphomicrobium sp.]
MADATATPIALTIAGSDSSGGAGIQADLKTFTVLGVYGASVLTALTAQSTRGVDAILPVPPEFVTQQIDAVAGDLDIAATKTGMLNDRATVLAVAAGVRRHALHPLVVDPVMVATSGDMLLQPDAVEAVRHELLPLADVITPNLAEAARLLDRLQATGEEEMEAQARALLALGPKAVLIKGGHGEGSEALDILVTRDAAPLRLALARVATPNTHGTGCTLSAAITAYLACGAPLEEAVSAAKRYVHAALEAATGAKIGTGAGPVDHLHSLRNPRKG